MTNRTTRLSSDRLWSCGRRCSDLHVGICL